MIRTYVIRHVAFEDLGLWEAPLEQRGEIRYFQAGVDDFAPCDQDRPDLLIVLGGPIGVYEANEYPFVQMELDLLRRRIDRGGAILGICLGAQLIAAAAGARVYPSGVKEIGWGPIKLTAAGQQSCLKELAQADHTVLHWHGDTFDLPTDATLLASTDLVEHQAFALGPKVLALQFHVEADPGKLERWLIGHACELSGTKIKPSELRRATQQLPQGLKVASHRMLNAWLANLNH